MNALSRPRYATHSLSMDRYLERRRRASSPPGARISIPIMRPSRDVANTPGSSGRRSTSDAVEAPERRRVHSKNMPAAQANCPRISTTFPAPNTAHLLPVHAHVRAIHPARKPPSLKPAHSSTGPLKVQESTRSGAFFRSRAIARPSERYGAHSHEAARGPKGPVRTSWPQRGPGFRR